MELTLQKQFCGPEAFTYLLSRTPSARLALKFHLRKFIKKMILVLDNKYVKLPRACFNDNWSIMFCKFRLGFFIVMVVSSAECYAACFQISRITIESGNSEKIKYIKHLNTIKRKYQGQCVSKKDVDNIAQEVTNAYMDKGYVTSLVLVPEQDLKTHILRLNVIHGHVEKIDLSEAQGVRVKTLPLTEKILNLRDLEQTIDHFANAPSNNLQLSLLPGEKKGGSIVKLINTPTRKWSVTSSVDNAGTKSKGEIQQTHNFTIDNLLGLNEVYSFGVRYTLNDKQDKYSRSYTTAFSIPFGYNQLHLTHVHSIYLDSLTAGKNRYSSKGGSKIARIGLDHTIHRDKASKTVLQTAFEYNDYANYIAERKIELSSYKLHKVEIGVMHQRRIERNVVGLGISTHFGKLRGYKVQLSNLSIPRNSFHKVTYHASWRRPIFGELLYYHLHASGQSTPQLLAPTEKNSVGGLTSVRGYKHYIENADNNLVARNELVLSLPKPTTHKMRRLFGNTDLFAAYDLGYFSNYEENNTKRAGKLAGLAMGLRNHRGKVHYAITAARPIYRLDGMKKNNNVIYFSIAVNV